MTTTVRRLMTLFVVLFIAPIPQRAIAQAPGSSFFVEATGNPFTDAPNFAVPLFLVDPTERLVLLLAEGTIVLGEPSPPFGPIGPDGDPDRSTLGYPVGTPGTAGALCAVFWNAAWEREGDPVVVGTANALVAPPNARYVQYGINDDWHVDNSGKLLVMSLEPSPVVLSFRITGDSTGTDWTFGFTPTQRIPHGDVPEGKPPSAFRDAFVEAINAPLPGRDPATQPQAFAAPMNDDEFFVTFPGDIGFWVDSGTDFPSCDVLNAWPASGNIIGCPFNPVIFSLDILDADPCAICIDGLFGGTP